MMGNNTIKPPPPTEYGDPRDPRDPFWEDMDATFGVGRRQDLRTHLLWAFNRDPAFTPLTAAADFAMRGQRQVRVRVVERWKQTIEQDRRRLRGLQDLLDTQLFRSDPNGKAGIVPLAWFKRVSRRQPWFTYDKLPVLRSDHLVPIDPRGFTQIVNLGWVPVQGEPETPTGYPERLRSPRNAHAWELWGSEWTETFPLANVAGLHWFCMRCGTRTDFWPDKWESRSPIVQPKVGGCVVLPAPALAPLPAWRSLPTPAGVNQLPSHALPRVHGR